MGEEREGEGKERSKPSFLWNPDYSFHINTLGLCILYQKQKLCLIKAWHGNFKLKTDVFKYIRCNISFNYNLWGHTTVD